MSKCAVVNWFLHSEGGKCREMNMECERHGPLGLIFCSFVTTVVCSVRMVFMEVLQFALDSADSHSHKC